MKALIPEEIVGGHGLTNKDAKLVNSVLQKARKEHGHVTTKELCQALIDSSRPSQSPTHHLFEWDPNKGHSLYLIERARQIIMRVEIVFAEKPKTRAWRGVIINGVRGPAPIKQIIASKELMSAVLEEAKAALQAWANKYAELQKLEELRDVFASIQKIKVKKAAPSGVLKKTG